MKYKCSATRCNVRPVLKDFIINMKTGKVDEILVSTSNLTILILSNIFTHMKLLHKTVFKTCSI